MYNYVMYLQTRQTNESILSRESIEIIRNLHIGLHKDQNGDSSGIYTRFLKDSSIPQRFLDS